MAETTTTLPTLCPLLLTKPLSLRCQFQSELLLLLLLLQLSRLMLKKTRALARMKQPVQRIHLQLNLWLSLPLIPFLKLLPLRTATKMKRRTRTTLPTPRRSPRAAPRPQRQLTQRHRQNLYLCLNL